MSDTRPKTFSLLELRSIRKRFGEVDVLRDVDLEVHAGEVHAVVGENGAGKSTLMRIAAGIHAPDGGRMMFCGREFAPRSPTDALRAGIAMAHQELSLAAELTVAENILAGLEPRWGWFVDWRKLYQRASAMLEEFCPAIDAYAPVSSLGMGDRQVVEILKTLAWEPKIIIFDEPTSSLEVHEAELVLGDDTQAESQRRSAWSISPTAWTRFSASATASPFCATARGWRDGGARKFPGRRCSAPWSGRELTQLYPAKAEQLGEVLFSVEGLSRRGNFERHRLCVASWRDPRFFRAGRRRTHGALMRAIFHADPLDSGTVLLEGRPRRFRSIQDAVQAGIAYVPEDRKTQGLFLDQSVEENILCANLKRCSRGGHDPKAPVPQTG